jgi:hypothetical protein
MFGHLHELGIKHLDAETKAIKHDVPAQNGMPFVGLASL